MMDTRDRLEEVGKNIKTHGDAHDDVGHQQPDEQSRLGQGRRRAEDQIEGQRHRQRADVPVSIIVQLRRFRLMEESQAPASWNSMLSNIENNMAPWKFSPSDRFNWADKLKS